MNWNMIGALGEIIGAVAVVVTLWYLASQVRQGTDASRQEAVRELMEQNYQIISWMNYSPQRAGLYIRGVLGDPDLSPEEVGQFGAFLLQLVTLWQRIYFLDQRTRVEEWFVIYVQAVRQEIAGTPGFRSWYEARSHWLHPRFRAVLDADMSRGVSYRPLGLAEDQLGSARSE